MSRPPTSTQGYSDDNLDLASYHSQQSTVLESDSNRKRKKGGSWRKKTDLKRMAEKILAWRDDVWRREYTSSYLPVDIIIDDKTIQRIAKFTRLRQPDELKKEWGGFDRYGAELLLVVEQVDEEIAAEKMAVQEQIRPRPVKKARVQETETRND